MFAAPLFSQQNNFQYDEVEEQNLEQKRIEQEVSLRSSTTAVVGNWWNSSQLSQYAAGLTEAANRKPAWAAEGERAALRAVESARSQWKGVESRAVRAMLHVRRVIDDEVERLRSLRLERDDVEAKKRGLHFLEEQCAESTLDAARRMARWLRREAELIAVGFSDDEDSSIDQDEESESTYSEDTFEGELSSSFDVGKAGLLNQSNTTPTTERRITARRLRERSSWLKRRALARHAKTFNEILGPYPAVDAFLNALPPGPHLKHLAKQALSETPERVLQRIFVCLGTVHFLGIGSLVCRAWRAKLDRSSPNNRRLWKWILRFGVIPPTGTIACRNLWLALAADRKRNAILDELSVDPAGSTSTNTAYSTQSSGDFGSTFLDLVLSMEEDAAFEEREGDDDLFDNPISWWRSAQRRLKCENARKWDSAIAVDAARTPLARLWRGIQVPGAECTFENASPELLLPYRAAVASACGRIARKYPNVGYCQGLDYLVAFALRASCFETDTAVTLVQALLDHLELGELFAPGLPGLKSRCRELRLLVDARCPRMAERLRSQALAVDLFAAPWLQTLFVYVDALPIAVLDRLWTLLFFERSFKPLHRLALALFVTIEPKLLATCHSPHHTLLFLTRLTSAEAHKKRRQASGDRGEAQKRTTTKSPMSSNPMDEVLDAAQDIPPSGESKPHAHVEIRETGAEEDPAVKSPQHSQAEHDLSSTKSLRETKTEKLPNALNPLDDEEDVIATDEETFCRELVSVLSLIFLEIILIVPQLQRAMNIKVTNAMLDRINANAALPRPLRLRGTSDQIPNPL